MQPLVLAEHLRVAAPQLLDQPRRPLDVREEERHRTAGEICHRKSKRVTRTPHARLTAPGCAQRPAVRAASRSVCGQW